MRPPGILWTAVALVAFALPAVSAGVASAATSGSPPVTEKDFNPANFHRSTTIDNRFLPLVPGTQITLDGTAVQGTQGTHREILTVTDVAKAVEGVSALVVWVRDVQAGALAEEELSLFAQDDAGNVWLMGENPDVYENGTVTADATWLGGRLGAIPGVAMRVDPRTNTSSYLQGRAPNAGFIDQAMVVASDQSVCAPVGCYRGVVVIDELDPSQQPQDGHQIKYHAPGVGAIRVEFRGGVTEETLGLTKLVHLNRSEIAAARHRVLELDEKALRLAPDVWKGTPHAHPILG